VSFSNYQQKIIINGFALSGVKSVDGSYGINESPVRVAGVGFVDALINSPLEGSFSISRDMVSQDPLVEVNSLGKYKYEEDYISGVILYDEGSKGFGFSKGRMSQYSVSCSVGQVPEIRTDIRVFGELGASVLSSSFVEINPESPHFPFGGDSVFLTDKNGTAIVDGAENLKTQWNEGSLTIPKNLYDNLSKESRLIKYSVSFALGFNIVSAGWYNSSWFIVANKGTTQELNFGLNYIPTGLDNDASEGWVFNKLFGWVYISALNFGIGVKRQLYFYASLVFENNTEYFWVWVDEDVLASHGLAYFFPQSQNFTGEGWGRFFFDSLGEYAAIVYLWSESTWYGLSDIGFQLTHLTNLQGRDLDASAEPSDAVPEDHDQVVASPDILALGQDSFNLYPQVVNAHPPIQFSDQSSISISVDDFDADAISDFSYTRTINMEPVYAIPKGDLEDWTSQSLATHKNLEPVQVDTQYPIETDINFTMIVSNYEIREIKDRIQSAPKSDVVINIKDSKTDDLINSFTGHNVRLISESINSSIDEEMSISLTYKGYDTLHNPVL
jgi:hypothetical protein